MTGRLTLPTDADVIDETLRLKNLLGADALRDCDGTEMPEELLSEPVKKYATYYTTRKDNEWASANPEEIQQEYLISNRVTARGETLRIRLMEGFHTEQLKVNTLDDQKRWWEVIDRTTGEIVPTDKWEFDEATGEVEIQTKAYHEYTVSFLAFLIWDPVHMYNFITNDWQDTPHQLTYDVRQPKTQKYVKEKLKRWCEENPNIDVVRFTTFFHQFTLTFDDQKREKYVEWFGYSASVSPYILEKFEKWAETLERAIGNPLYHWSHLELQRFFGYTGDLNRETASEVWELCNRKLQEEDMRVRSLIKTSGVTLLCTTDDPVDDLRLHKMIKDDPEFDVQVLPAWRPDKVMNIEKPEFTEYIKTLADAADMEINDFSQLKEALQKRMDFFAASGCRVSDHGINYVMYAPASEKIIEEIFSKRFSQKMLTKLEMEQYKTACLLFFSKEYKKRGWVMQLHYGCKRDNNQIMYQQLGPDTGYDCINNYAPAEQLTDFLNAAELQGGLPRTILYSLNPGDDTLIDSVIGCFQNSDAIGKMQHGSSWWFNDNKTGMEKQMTSLANLGMLANFVGMLTDSRSFLSYPRHEYFRRILCNLLGTWVENGEYPDDMKRLGKIVKDISYNNAVRYFGFDLQIQE